jgi:hypothetical protein
LGGIEGLSENARSAIIDSIISNQELQGALYELSGEVAANTDANLILRG